MCKFIAQAEEEITPNVETFDYYACNVKAFLSVKISNSVDGQALVRHSHTVVLRGV